MAKTDSSLLEKVLRKQKVIFAYLFGSQVGGEIGALSDVDIAVYLDEKLSRHDYFDLKLKILGDLTDLLKTDNIDIAILNEAPPLLAQRILKEGRLIFSSNEKKRLTFETKAVLRYLDWKPYLKKYTKEVFG